MKTYFFLIGLSLLLFDKFNANPDSLKREANTDPDVKNEAYADAYPDVKPEPDLHIHEHYPDTDGDRDREPEPSPDPDSNPYSHEPELETTTNRPRLASSNTTNTTSDEVTISPDHENQTTGNFTIDKSDNATQSGMQNVESTTEPLYYDSDESRRKTTTPTTTTRKRRDKDEDSSKYKSKSSEEWYLKFRDRHSLPEPFQLPGKKRLVDLEDMAYCKCPRVYWPVCAKNNITYLNYCIMDCLDQDIRRYGPCINYRRDGDHSSGLLTDK